MSFVQAKCPECGGMLAVDDSKKAEVCQLCGEAFVIEDAINNYKINNEIFVEEEILDVPEEFNILDIPEIPEEYLNIDVSDTSLNTEELEIPEVPDIPDITNNYVLHNKEEDFVIEAGVLKHYAGTDNNVVIPDGVIRIGICAFKDCTSLVSVTLPESLRVIDWYAFKNCTNLISITIPEGVKLIGKNAFENTPVYNEIKETELVSIEPCSNKSEKEVFVIKKGVLKEYKGSSLDVIIPDGVIEVGKNCFIGSKIESVVIPEGVTKISKFAFGKCKNLTSVNIPNSVRSIEFGAFSQCKNLDSVIIPESVTNVNKYAFDTTCELKKGL